VIARWRQAIIEGWADHPTHQVRSTPSRPKAEPRQRCPPAHAQYSEDEATFAGGRPPPAPDTFTSSRAPPTGPSARGSAVRNHCSSRGDRIKRP
jgi:hypothetical protein